MSGPAAHPAGHRLLDAVLELGGAALRERMARIETRLREIAAGAAPPLDGWASTTIAAGGKRLRPLLVLLAGAGADDDAGLIRAGVAVELVHSATLVHDDVLDSAPLRRGVPTVWSSAGREAAIATGDLLFARAFAEIADPAHRGGIEAVRILSGASGALAQGELLQREDAFRDDVTVQRYLHRCELKTARLFRAACELGALEGDPAGRPALGAFGERIGLAFQLLDDVLDVSGPVARTGKHRGTDLLDGTVTLPLILARERDPSLGHELPRTPEEAEALCDRIAATGALDDARAHALEIVDRAKHEVPRDDPALRLVADSVVARYA